MKRILLCLLLSGFLLKGFGQIKNNLEFIDFKMVVDDVKASKSKVDIKSKWDYLLILLLDSSFIDIISEIRPDIVQEFRRNYSFPISDENKKVLLEKVNSIQECFLNEKILDLIYSNTTIEADLKDKNLSSPIYIKDNKIAVFEIFGESWSECNRLTITDNGLLIEMIYIIME